MRSSIPIICCFGYKLYLQVLLAAVPAARTALEELLSCSVVPPDAETRGLGGGGSMGPKKGGDLRPILRRLPPDCARACFLAVPQVWEACMTEG